MAQAKEVDSRYSAFCDAIPSMLVGMILFPNLIQICKWTAASFSL